EVFPMSNEDILSETDRIVENARDPNFKVYKPNFEGELYDSANTDLSRKESLKENRSVQPINCELHTSKLINKKEDVNDLLYAFGFVMVLGWIGIGGVLRYIINPEIPT